MSFGKIFGDTWREYVSNWKVFTKFLLIFLLIPSVILAIFSSYSQVNLANMGLQFASGIMGILFFGLFILASVGIIYEVIKKKKGKYEYTSMFLGGKEYFWRYLGFIMLLSVIILGILIALIIPFILLLGLSNRILTAVVGGIFMIAFIVVIVYLFVRWAFTPYILINENKHLMESFSSSSRFVKGRWVKIFGYFLMFGLIVGVIEVIIFGITEAINFLISIPFEDLVRVIDEVKIYPLKIQLARNLISSISSFIINIITLPLGALFTKNLYFSLKKNNKIS